MLEAAGLLQPSHPELMRQAAQGKVLHNDDTPMRILNRKTFEREGRKAIQTTAILSDLGANRIALFITGQNHAGENLGAVLNIGRRISPSRSRCVMPSPPTWWGTPER